MKGIPVQLSNARYWINDGYPMLGVEVDGRTTNLIAECKPSVYNAGIVFLGADFADVVPAIDLDLPADDGGGRIHLEGFTRDAQLYRLYTDFLKAAGDGTFKSGPVRIPR